MDLHEPLYALNRHDALRQIEVLWDRIGSGLQSHREHVASSYMAELGGSSDYAIMRFSAIMDPKAWQYDNLIESQISYSGRTMSLLRSPKVILQTDITSRGNLTLRWKPDLSHKGADFTYPPFLYDLANFKRPMNEILFVKGFEDCVRGATWPPRTTADEPFRAFCCRLLEATKIVVTSVAEDLARLCGAQLGSKLAFEYEPNSAMISKWRVDHDHSVTLPPRSNPD